MQSSVHKPRSHWFPWLYHDFNSKNSHQTLISIPMLENMNNAVPSEHWPASVLSPACLILSSFAHISAFILWRLAEKKSPKCTQGCRRRPLIFDGCKYGNVWRLTQKTNAAATHATGSSANESPALVFGIVNISPHAFQKPPGKPSWDFSWCSIRYFISLLEEVQNMGRTFEDPSSFGNQN